MTSYLPPKQKIIQMGVAAKPRPELLGVVIIMEGGINIYYPLLISTIQIDISNSISDISNALK